MRDPKEGVSLAAIVAAETKDGEWSGSGGGLGLGMGGIGVFAGGAAGNTREQSKRAQDFEAPTQSEFNWKRVYNPAIAATIIGFLIAVMATIAKFGGSGVDPDGRIVGVQATLASLNSSVGIIVPILCFLFAGYYVVIGSNKAVANENERLQRLEEFRPIRENVYQRLRYVEADHVVFDPVTGRETPAERIRILNLLDELANAEMPETEKE